MKTLVFATHTIKEILRDPLNLCFRLWFGDYGVGRLGVYASNEAHVMEMKYIKQPLDAKCTKRLFYL